MPRIIQTSCKPVPKDGLLVSSAYLRNDISASALVLEARRRANDILNEAREDAGNIRCRARDEGYANGFVMMAEAVADHLERHAELASSIWVRLADEMRNVLQACVDNPAVIAAALEQTLARYDASATQHQTIEVLLPETWRDLQGDPLAKLATRCEWTIRLAHWTQPRIVARFAEHVVEFIPADFVDRALAEGRHLQAELGGDSADVTAQCRAHMLELFDAAHQRPDTAGATSMPSEVCR